MKDGKVFIWMQLLGFNKNDEDKGAKRFLDQTGFIPDGACGLVFHSDFFHHHRGMDEEYVLHPDNCSYYGIPRNIERERQEWTNYEMADVKIISKFPILPPRFMDINTNEQVYLYTGEEVPKRAFEIKMQPAGVTIVDIYLK